MTKAECEALLLELAAPVVTFACPLANHNCGPWCWTTRPATANDVAARLLMLGCKGIRGVSCDCPVAAYLSLFGADADVSPGCIIFGAGEFDYVPGNDTVDWFISNFDGGAYPELAA